MANSNGWGDGAANNAIGWGQGANNSISWGKSHSLSNAGATDIVGLTTDADAQAFITAAAITDATQQSAIDTLVKGLKTDGVWTKMKAIYPFVGGTASTHKYNLKDPRDLDAAFRLVFNGGWTHSSTGATPNGTNGYADTKCKITDANSGHLSFYSRTNSVFTSCSMGGVGGGGSQSALFLTYASNQTYLRINSTGTTLPISTTNSLGYFVANRISSAGTRNFVQSSIIAQTDASIGVQNTNNYIGALSGSGTANSYDNKQVAFSSIGDGLTDTEASNLYTRVQAFQTALSRQV
jgi:hypothetical protein